MGSINTRTLQGTSALSLVGKGLMFAKRYLELGHIPPIFENNPMKCDTLEIDTRNKSSDKNKTLEKQLKT